MIRSNKGVGGGASESWPAPPPSLSGVIIDLRIVSRIHYLRSRCYIPIAVLGRPKGVR